MTPKETEINSSVRINGVDYPCHEDVSKMFATMWEDGFLTAKERDSLKRENQILKTKLEKTIDPEIFRVIIIHN